MSLFRKIKNKLYKAVYPSLGEVWMLHRVVDKISNNNVSKEIEITQSYLEQLIVKYKKKGYEFISIDDVIYALETRYYWIKHKKFVCVTLDDGYEDNYKYAYPIFKKHRIPFIIYLTTGFIDGIVPMWWYDSQPSTLTWQQVTQLSLEPLCTLGAHSINHKRLSDISMESAKKEILQSKINIEEHIGKTIEHFSYPHGAYNNKIIDILLNTGFKSSVLVWGGNVRSNNNVLEIPRIHIRQK